MGCHHGHHIELDGRPTFLIGGEGHTARGEHGGWGGRADGRNGVVTAKAVVGGVVEGEWAGRRWRGAVPLCAIARTRAVMSNVGGGHGR
jgi:hypothetical protein